MSGMNIVTDFSKTPIGFLQDAAGSNQVLGRQDYKRMVQMNLVSPQIAYPFLDFKGKRKVIDQMYGPKSPNPVLTDAQVTGLVYHNMITDLGAAMYASDRHLLRDAAGKKAFIKDASKRIIESMLNDAPSSDGGQALGY